MPTSKPFLKANMLIYKILRPSEWTDLQTNGETTGAPIDVADGYIHFSTAEQVRETVTKHFAGAGDLVLVAFEANDLGDALKWEVSRGDALFPHLYALLPLDKVVWNKPLVEGADGYSFPADIP